MLLNVIDKRKNFIFTLLLIAGILLPAVSFADADKIFKENNKAVVVVVTYNAKGEPISQGSGFIVRPDGAVITNYHVISNAVDIAVKAGDKVLKVEGLLHVDKENDLVILKVNGKDLPFARIGDIAKMNIGEKVYVISSPQGLENTISDGILSGIREITSKKKILQITAPVSAGSSGGPVFNKNGEVIGIATFIIKEAQNLNFAMPVNLIKDKISSEKIAALKDAGIIDYTKTADYWFNLGVAYDKAGLYDKAIEAYTKAIAIDPNDADAFNNRGNAYTGLKKYKQAIKDFDKAIELDPKVNTYYSTRGLTYFLLKEYQQAIKDFDKAIALNPQNADAYIFRGGINYLVLKKYHEAIKDYSKAIELNPKDVDSYKFRGHIYYDLNKYQQAINDYDKAIELNPKDAETYKKRAIAYRQLGSVKAVSENLTLNDYNITLEYQHAINDYNKAIELNPKDAEAYKECGSAYYMLKEYKQAIKYYDKAIEFAPKDVETYKDRGIAYDRLGKQQEAFKDFDKAIEFVDPKDASSLGNFFVFGYYQQAIKAYNKAIVLNPNDAHAYSMRGFAYKEKGQYDRAIEDFNKAIALDPNDAASYNNRGLSYSMKGQYDKAIQDYNKAIAIDPNLASAYNNRGFFYLYRKGQYDRAIADYSKVIALNPNDASTHIKRGQAYYRKGQYDRAIEDYSKAIVLDPNDASTYIMRGYVYSLSGDRGTAISDFQKACDLGLELGCKALQEALEKK